MQTTGTLLFHTSNVLMQLPMATVSAMTAAAPRRARVATRIRPSVASPNSSPVIYLTFDDGTTSAHTELILESLARADARATFFVTTATLGAASQVVRRMVDAGHTVGSHGHQHLDAWTMTNKDYVTDVETSITRLAAEGIATSWYRPPFGHIRPATFSLAREHGFSVAGWDVMPGDFRSGATTELVVGSAKRSIRTGSIVVLHDNARMRDAGITVGVLDKLLADYSALGWSFEALPTL